MKGFTPLQEARRRFEMTVDRRAALVMASITLALSLLFYLLIEVL